MATIYIASVRTATPKTTYMLSPSFNLQVKRDSKAARAEAIDRLVKLLRENVPCCYYQSYDPNDITSARAYLEVSDRHGSRTLAVYSGIELTSDVCSGAAYTGLWSLISRYDSTVHVPVVVAAG